MNALSAQAAREVRRDTPMRQARTCYGHLAGVAGVALLDGLLRCGWLIADLPMGTRPQYRLTGEGGEALRALGVALPAAALAGRPAGFACLDWTERRPHLGGALAAAIVRALCDSGVIRRGEGTRAVAIHRPVGTWLYGIPAHP